MPRLLSWRLTSSTLCAPYQPPNRLHSVSSGNGVTGRGGGVAAAAHPSRGSGQDHLNASAPFPGIFVSVLVIDISIRSCS